MAEGDTTGPLPAGDVDVPHEREHAEATLAELARLSTHPAIASLAVPSAAYVEAEAVTMAETVNHILDVLRDAKLIPDSAPPQ